MATQEEPTFTDIDGHLIRLTHLSKVLFPDDGITKAEILRFYFGNVDLIMPHLEGRPVTLKAFPHGITGRPYYRRNLSATTPDWVSRINLTEGANPVIKNAADLMWVVNQDSIELLTWLARVSDLDRPDQAIFDLDPGDGLQNERLCEAAEVLMSTLDDMGLKSWAKTSGSKGIHILVGIEPDKVHEEVRAWVLAVARVMVEFRPDLYTIGYSKENRRGRVLIDYNQNGFGRTTASIYSVRPLPGAPISAPVTRNEIRDGVVTPRMYGIRNIEARLADVGDVAAGLVSDRQKLAYI